MKMLNRGSTDPRSGILEMGAALGGALFLVSPAMRAGRFGFGFCKGDGWEQVELAESEVAELHAIRYIDEEGPSTGER